MSIRKTVMRAFSTINVLSMRISDLRFDFLEARDEIDTINGDRRDFSHILRQVPDTDADYVLPSKLSKELVSLLEDCRQTAIEGLLHIERFANKPLRCTVWALSGHYLERGNA
jgi:hypothetical protein